MVEVPTIQTILLCEAIKAGNYIEVETTLRNGADPQLEIDKNHYYTPWHWLYNTESLIITTQLCINGDPNTILDEFLGQTVLFGAITSLNQAKIAILVQHGADINHLDDDMYSPIFSTLISEECMELIPLLLKLGANLSIGIERLVEWKRTSNTYIFFCEQIVRFLDESYRNNDWEILKFHIPIILALNGALPETVIQKAQDLNSFYCFDAEKEE